MQAPSSRHVSFSQRVKVKKTLSAFNYTSDEMQSTWYDIDEMEDIILEVQRTVQMISKGEHLDESCHCQRGIESKTPQGKDTTRSNRREARKAVLKTQEQQRQKGIVDQEDLASVYAAYSSVSQYTAQAIGRSDERAAALGVHVDEVKMASDKPTYQRRAEMLLSKRRERLQQIACAAA